MDFSGVPASKWQPTTTSQKAKYKRLTTYATSLPTTSISPDDCNILPYHRYLRHPEPTDLQVDAMREQQRRAAERRRVVHSEHKKAANAAVLDGFAMLAGCGISASQGNMLPDEARRCDVSGQGLGRVDQEDLGYYTRLDYVDAGDNALSVADFGPLPRLRELRLHCNGISGNQTLRQAVSEGGFSRLATLDLSYNALTPDAFAQLSSLPMLTELDVTYNMLELLPPPDVMQSFRSLTALNAANNGFESDSVLISLSVCPMLSSLNLAYNYLQRIPKDVIEDGCFSHLQTMNLSYNYVTEEEELLPAVLIERLTRLLVFGNPLCGQDGEDFTGECVERVIEASIEARDGWGENELVVVTASGDDPHKGGGGKGGKRQALYKDLQMSAVLEDNMPTAAQFRRAGNRALNVVGLQPEMRETQVVVPGGSRGKSRDGSSRGEASNTFVTGLELEDGEEDGEEEDGGGLVVPGSLLQKSLNAGAGRADPSKLSAAIYALRHALKASDSEGLSLKINDPRTGVNRPNASYRARMLPKREFQAKRAAGEGDEDEEEYKARSGGMRAVTPGIINAALKAKAEGKNALHELEDMLHEMEDRMEDIEHDRGGGGGVGGDGRARTAGVASRSGDRAIGNLVSMVNNVVDEFN
jgi:hypothetical protein